MPIRPLLSNSSFQEQHNDEITKKKDVEEEDPWAKFNQMSAHVSSIVKNTQEQLKNLSENSTANTIQDESYLAQIG